MIETSAAKIGPMNNNGELMVYHGISGCTALSMQRRGHMTAALRRGISQDMASMLAADGTRLPSTRNCFR